MASKEMKKHQSTEGKSDVWFTPEYIVKALGMFDMDPATSQVTPFQIAPRKLWENGLELPWTGRVWLNPPFNRYERPKWMARMAKHGNGIMLIPAATETVPFKDYVWNGGASAILFLDHRPHFLLKETFEPSKANCGCTICLVAYGENNVIALRKSDLGVTVQNWNIEL